MWSHAKPRQATNSHGKRSADDSKSTKNYYTKSGVITFTKKIHTIYIHLKKLSQRNIAMLKSMSLLQRKIGGSKQARKK